MPMRLWSVVAIQLQMPVLGQGEEHPNTHERVRAPAGLTDQDIMDLVAYLQALK